MIDLLVLILLLSVVCVWFFIKKRPNKIYRNISIVVTTISFVAIGVIAPNNKPRTAKKEVVTSTKSSKKVTSSSLVKEESPNSASKTVETKDKQENEFASKEKEKSSSVAASISKSETATSESNVKHAKAEQKKMKSFARTFGNKPAQELQRKSYTYSSNNIDGMGMVYMWKNDFGILMRVDSPDNITSVYLYDANVEQGKGELLYQGHTITNEQKKQYNFYN